MNLCKYKNIFGKPNTGIHKYRIGNVAAIDLILTILIALVITYFTKIPITLALIVLFILAIIIHFLFCVNTSVSKFLGIK